MTTAVDNFEKIRTYLDRNKYVKDKFYLIQILLRKGNVIASDNGNRARMLKSFTIEDIEDLNKYESEIKWLCDCTGARAYFNPNARNARKAALETIKVIADRLVQSQEDRLIGIYEKGIMNSPIVGGKTWILDFDRKEYATYEDMMTEVQVALDNIVFQPDGDIQLIPSKSGMHIVTDPFNRVDFYAKLERAGVQHKFQLLKDSLTNLYIPSDDTLPDDDQTVLEF